MIFNNTVRIIAVPYFSWGNRETGEILVWVNKLERGIKTE
jgi:DUF1680 family protein